MSTSQPYFNRLNYSLGNEDTSLEVAILPEKVGHVFSVAGSGSRVVPLLAKFPERITCIDVAQEQLFITELRFAAIRALSHSEYVSFLGYPPSPATPEERKKLFGRLELTPDAGKFFTEYFQSNGWTSLLYDGKWERTFNTLSRFNRLLTGQRGAGLFEARAMKEQREYLARKFPHFAWGLVVRMLGNASVFDALLYKGHCAKKNIPESFQAFYLRTFRHLFDQALARESYFLQLCFFGQVKYAEGNPIECDSAIYAKAKEAIKNCEVRFVKGDVIEEAAKSPVPIDFYSISDVPSYFSGVRESSFLQALSKGLAPNALVVLRYYLHVPEGKETDGYEDVTARYAKEISAEKVGVYNVEVMRWLRA